MGGPADAGQLDGLVILKNAAGPSLMHHRFRSPSELKITTFVKEPMAAEIGLEFGWHLGIPVAKIQQHVLIPRLHLFILVLQVPNALLTGLGYQAP